MDDGCVNDKNCANDKGKSPHTTAKNTESNDVSVNKPWTSKNNNNVNQPSAYKSDRNGIAAEEFTVSLNDCAYGKAMSGQLENDFSTKQGDDDEAIKRINGLSHGIKVNHSIQNDTNQHLDYNIDQQSTDNNDGENNESDSNSTDNLSFVSEDGLNEIVGNGIIDDIILLPNNLISEDELSTNSDDCVYAYRGADFDPVPENTEDENDFLEMDFEPDPASEIEQENIGIPVPSRNVRPLFEPASIVERSSNGSRDIEEHDPCQPRKIDESSNSIPNKNTEWRNQTEKVANASWKDEAGNNVNEAVNHMGRNDEARTNSMETLEIQKHAWLENNQMKNMDASGASCSAASISEESYYDQTISLSSKRYTGTIPKTNRLISIPRPNRSTKNSSLSKPSNDSQANKCSEDDNNSFSPWASRSHDACKRWKINEEESGCSHSISFRESNQSIIFGTSGANRVEYPMDPSTSFSCDSNRNSNDVFQVHLHRSNDRSEPSNGNAETYSSQASDCTDYQQLNDSTYSANDDYDTSFVHDTVTIYSIDCTIDIIVKALSKLNITPDLEVLRHEIPPLRDPLTDSVVTLTMNIPEYLVYMSKLNCNYKAIISAIKLACKSQELDIKFFPTESIMLKPEVVCVPICEILDKLPNNGSLKNILAIRNKQFHRANVLGKIVNCIRKFSDMRYDIIKENYITIPQYYRSGYICISKAEANNNDT